MKLKTKLFVALSACALVGGASAGLMASKDAVEAKAADTFDGKIIIKKNDNDMKWTGSKLVGYLFDDSSHNAWGNPVANDGKTYQEYTWSNLNFEPTKIIILRVASDWTSGWTCYCRTGNISLADADVVWMHGDAKEENDNNHWGIYSTETIVKSESNASIAELENLKIASNGEAIETWGSVTLTDNQKFYISATVDGDKKYNNYSCIDAISSNLSKNGNFIQVTDAATYELYFDFDAKTTFITDPVLANADEWAQEFLKGGCSSTMANWTDHASSYAGLSNESKQLFLDVAENGNESGTFVEQAVARYDLVEKRYGKTAYAEFMGRESAGKLSPKAAGNLVPVANGGSGFSVGIAAIATISVVAVAISGGLILRRKVDR